MDNLVTFREKTVFGLGKHCTLSKGKKNVTKKENASGDTAVRTVLSVHERMYGRHMNLQNLHCDHPSVPDHSGRAWSVARSVASATPPRPLTPPPPSASSPSHGIARISSRPKLSIESDLWCDEACAFPPICSPAMPPWPL